MDLNNEIKNLVFVAKASQLKINTFEEKKINKIIIEINKKILTKSINFQLSKLAVEETKFGNINDKVIKNFYKTNSLVKELLKQKLSAPFKNSKKNIYEIYKPIGVICGVTPSTNPIATPLNYILNSIKSRNSIIICPNPRAYNTCLMLIENIRIVLKKHRFPINLINIAPKELLRSEMIINLFNLCDRNIVTGNKNFISKVQKSNKPYLIFGAGNPPIVIDKDVDLKKVVKSVIDSKSFDYSTSCSSDSVLIVNQEIYKNFLKELIKNHLYILNQNEKKRLDDIYFVKGTINQKIIAKNPNLILEMIDIKVKKKIKVIGYEINSETPKHYIFDEKILPLIGIVKAKNFNHSVKIAKKVLNINGLGHSAGIYSKKKSNIMFYSQSLPVSRVLVNQPHSKSAGGNENNGLNTTLSLGCGNWGNNILNENLALKEFCNITRVVFRKKKKKNDRKRNS